MRICAGTHHHHTLRRPHSVAFSLTPCDYYPLLSILGKIITNVKSASIMIRVRQHSDRKWRDASEEVCPIAACVWQV